MPKKRIIINEEQEKKLVRLIREEKEAQNMPVPDKSNKPYCIDPEKVLIVKKHLDGRFGKKKMSTVGNDGRPCLVKIVTMKDDFGNDLKSMYMEQLKDYLLDTFQNMFSDEKESELFFDKVMNSWFDNKISVHGMLDVNHL